MCVRTEANAHAANIDPVRAVGGKADQLALMEAGRVDHDVVQVLAADMAVVHDEDIALDETPGGHTS